MSTPASNTKTPLKQHAMRSTRDGTPRDPFIANYRPSQISEKHVVG